VRQWTSSSRTDKKVNAVKNVLSLDCLVTSSAWWSSLSPITPSYGGCVSKSTQNMATSSLTTRKHISYRPSEQFLQEVRSRLMLQNKYSNKAKKGRGIAQESFIELHDLFALPSIDFRFDARKDCHERSYRYLLPEEQLLCHPLIPGLRKGSSVSIKLLNDPEEPVEDELMSSLNQLSRKFEGTHNFRNFLFTSAPQPSDTSYHTFPDEFRSANSNDRRVQREHDGSSYRTIHYFRCNTRIELRGNSFLCLDISGRSFAHKQIRKLVGFVLAIHSGLLPQWLIDASLNVPNFPLRIPVAPAELLLLESVYFDKKRQLYFDQSDDICGKRVEVFRNRLYLDVAARNENFSTFSQWKQQTMVSRSGSISIAQLKAQYDAWTKCKEKVTENSNPQHFQ